jgi:hypothetical protein
MNKPGRPAGSKESYKPDPYPSLASSDGWVRLGAAIVAQAGLEARAGDREARAWLRSDDAGLIAELLGIDPAAIRRKVRTWARPGGKIIIRLFVGGG